jgi:hypothetical protein
VRFSRTTFNGNFHRLIICCYGIEEDFPLEPMKMIQKCLAQLLYRYKYTNMPLLIHVVKREVR